MMHGSSPATASSMMGVAMGEAKRKRKTAHRNDEDKKISQKFTEMFDEGQGMWSVRVKPIQHYAVCTMIAANGGATPEQEQDIEHFEMLAQRVFREGMLCFTCEHRFTRDNGPPGGLAAMSPHIDNPTKAMVAPVCYSCFSCSNFRQNLIAALKKHILGSDAREVNLPTTDIGHA
jgi:hypothetical protein